ncbi:MAG: hypothetical protein CO149_00280 [Nitrospirae bacterium CG_4_9_14_3_um_filter_51_5]|nr:MAG: hypothetical protein CO149_00280 [Nitrospirae bacterium CG_4_9_14_3_um_filter_51_5]
MNEKSQILSHKIKRREERSGILVDQAWDHSFFLRSLLHRGPGFFRKGRRGLPQFNLKGCLCPLEFSLKCHEDRLSFFKILGVSNLLKLKGY